MFKYSWLNNSILSSLLTYWILKNGILDGHTAAALQIIVNLHALLQAVESILDFSTGFASYFCCFDHHRDDMWLSRVYDVVGVVCVMLPWCQPLFSVFIWTMDYLCNLFEFCHLQGLAISFTLKKVVRCHISLPIISTAVYLASLVTTGNFTGVYACRKVVFLY